MLSTALQDLRKLLTAACDHYEHTAPTVWAYCDDLYARLDGPHGGDIRLCELTGVAYLRNDGVWLTPACAANHIYKLEDRLGRDTTGHAGF